MHPSSSASPSVPYALLSDPPEQLDTIDIVGILDSSGSLVVDYKYNAWGKPLSITGTLTTSLGEMNPFRYRGYVYDTETGLYYLRSRYYNALLNRFTALDTDKTTNLCKLLWFNLIDRSK